MTNDEYIKTYKEADIRSLALKKVPESVNALWCLHQIEGYQLAKKKLPRWAETEGLWFPPRISMEQCSSESTAQYKAALIRKLLDKAEVSDAERSLVDITGGFGVDFSFMAKAVTRAVYVEQQQVLCEAMQHNAPLLGLENAEICNADSATFSKTLDSVSVVFADPARRDDAGRKTVGIADCTPDITLLQDALLEKADFLIIKLSPMLDITQALRELNAVTEVHVVSVKGECKELLFVMSEKHACSNVTYHCVNLDTEDTQFEHDGSAVTVSCGTPSVGDYLFEPNVSILKAGLQNAFAERYTLQKVHIQSNLFFTSADMHPTINDIPARAFRITAVTDFSKRSLKTFLSDIKQANITIRNFPSTVAELRKRLKLKEGGNVYIFATTFVDGSHALLRCEKA